MTDERINKIKAIFNEHSTIVKAATLREHKICSRDITELLDNGYVVKIKTGYYAWNSRFYDLHDLEIIQGLIPMEVNDFFKYSSKVGNDVALEVMKNYMIRKNKNLRLLFEYATKLRVNKYIKPYVEVLL